MQCTGNSGCFPRGKRAAIVRRYPCFVCVFLCAVFSCFRNPPNSDVVYRIFNVRPFLCVRLHTEVGHTDNESAQHFDSNQYVATTTSSVQFSSVQDGIHAAGKAHMRSTPSLRRFRNVAFETVPMLV